MDIIRDLFGEGIFAVNGGKWRQQRKLASHEVLRDFSCAAFRRSAAKLARIVLEISKAKQSFDIHVSISPHQPRFCIIYGDRYELSFGLDSNINQVRYWSSSNLYPMSHAQGRCEGSDIATIPLNYRIGEKLAPLTPDSKTVVYLLFHRNEAANSLKGIFL